MQTTEPKSGTIEDKWILIFSGVLTVATIWQGYNTSEQLAQMKVDSTLQEKQFTATQEPQVGFTKMDVTPSRFNNREALAFTPHFTNTGPTVGRIDEVVVRAGVFPAEKKRYQLMDFVFAENKSKAYDLPVRRDDEISQTVRTDKVLTDVELAGINDKTQKLWVVVYYRVRSDVRDKSSEWKVFTFNPEKQRMEMAPID